MNGRLKPYICAVSFGLLILTLLFENDASTMYVLAAAVIHEAGHIVAMKLCGAKINGVGLSGMGAFIGCERTNVSYVGEICISLAGIAANCSAAATAVIFHAPTVFITANIALATFNIIPVKGLDGYHAVRAAMFYANDDIAAAEQKLTLVSGISLLVLWFAACFIQLKTGGSLSLLFIGLFMIIKSVKEIPFK